MLYLYPKRVEVINRQINYDYKGRTAKMEVNEKMSFQNKLKSNLNEIIIGIETNRTKLRIVDEDNKELTYEELKRNILRIILNKPVFPNAYMSVFLSYINYESPNREKLSRLFNFFKSPFFFINVDFYGNEKLSIFTEWEDAIELGYFNIFYYNKKQKYLYSFIPENGDFSHNLESDYISFSISHSERVRKNISSIRMIYLFNPEKEQLRLFSVLTVFTLLFPFTEIISVILSNISYLFDSIEVEVVLMLTLAFAETRTKLISPKKIIIFAVILTGVFFIISLIASSGMLQYFHFKLFLFTFIQRIFIRS